MPAPNDQRQRNDLAPSRLRPHDGRCGARQQCWRPACRTRFGLYRTVEVLPDIVRAYCHGAEYARDDLAVRAIAAYIAERAA